MTMYFVVEHLPDATGEEAIPPPPKLPMIVDDAVINGLVRNHCLSAAEVNDPRKVLDAVERFVKVGLGLLVAQRVSGTKQ
jgi:hypothetical protein